MTRQLLGASSASEVGLIRDVNSKFGENPLQQCGSSWYLSKKEIENFSPSRKDGISLRKESEIRKSYATFLQKFGKRLRLPQVTIATAIIYCHRFYLHQSHAWNDWQTVATACIFLASKVEYTPVSLEKLTKLAYETIYEDSSTARTIHQKDVYEKQKALILIGERLVLSTIRFGFDVQHPYMPLTLALKKFGIAGKDVRQVAWNFINDSLHTTLCLQYKPHYIAAASLYLAAKLHNVKLPSEQGYSWWQEFDVTPKLLHAAVQEIKDLFVVPFAPVKPTQTPLVTKTEASNSPDSCVLSRPNSARSSSSQCSGGDGGKQRPPDIIIPGNVEKLNPDAGHVSVAVKTEMQFQIRDFASPDSVVEESRKSGVDVEKIEVKPGQAAGIEDCHKFNEPEVDTLTKSEQTVGTGNCQASDFDLEPARTEAEQVPSNKDLERSGECIHHSTPNSKDIEDAINGHGPGEGTNLARIPEQVLRADSFEGSGEWMNESRAPEQNANVMNCSEPGEGADAPTAAKQLAHDEGCPGSLGSMGRLSMEHEHLSDMRSHGNCIIADSTMLPEPVNNEGCCDHLNMATLPSVKSEQVVENCQGFDEGLDQTKMTTNVLKVDIARITLLKRKKKERETPSHLGVCNRSSEDSAQTRTKTENMEAAVLPSIMTDRVPSTVDCQGSGEGWDQTRTKPENGANGSDGADELQFVEDVANVWTERVSPSHLEQGLDRICKPENVTNGLHRTDKLRLIKDVVNVQTKRGLPSHLEQKATSVDRERILALRKKRKSEVKVGARKESMDGNSEDSWIEKQLECVELMDHCTAKREKLSRP